MRSPILLGLLATIGFGVAKVCAVPATIDSDLKGLLSKGASISHDTSVAPRWSEFNPPQPGTIVSVATEDDVAKTVRNTLLPLCETVLIDGANVIVRCNTA